MATVSYRVVVTREGGQWLADVPELEGTHTYARHLSALDRYVREVVVLGADLPDDAMDEVELDYDFDTGDELIDREVADLRRTRRALDAAERDLRQRTRTDVRELVARGYSVRDASLLTGVSYQRVSQLATMSDSGST